MVTEWNVPMNYPFQNARNILNIYYLNKNIIIINLYIKIKNYCRVN